MQTKIEAGTLYYDESNRLYLGLVDDDAGPRVADVGNGYIYHVWAWTALQHLEVAANGRDVHELLEEVER